MTNKAITRASFWLLCILGLGAGMYHQLQRPTFIRLCANALQSAITASTQQTPSLLAAAPTFAIGKRVSLRKLTHADFSAQYKILEDPQISNMFFLAPNGTSADMPPWFYMYNELIDQFFRQRLVYSVLINRTSNIGGLIELRKNTKENIWQIGGFAAQAYQGASFSTETVRLIMKIFFETTTNECLYSHVAPENKRAQAFNLKCGFIFSHISTQTTSVGYHVFVISRSTYEQLNAPRTAFS